jgi:hypothetical protein
MSENTKTIQFDASLLQGGTRRRKESRANKTKRADHPIPPVQLNRNILKWMRQQQLADHKQYLMKGASIPSATDAKDTLQKSLDYFQNKTKTEEKPIPESNSSSFPVGFGALHPNGVQTGGQNVVQNGIQTGVYKPSVLFPTGGLEIPGIIPQTLLPSSQIPLPKFGCLKNAKLPTYRQMMRSGSSEPVGSMPHGGKDHSGPNGPNDKKRGDIAYQKALLEKIDASIGGKKEDSEQKKRHVRTYRVGRINKGQVSVLLSNKAIRRNITQKKRDLRRIPIQKVRQELVKKGFIRMGSTAPDNVLREIYENVEMIGQVKNFSPDILMHNLLG